MTRRFTALIVLDGWGHSDDRRHNAVALAKTPFFDRLWSSFPRTLAEASGERVGLPAGQMGNSEVGHLNLGAGRVVYQDLVRITKSVRDGDFFRNQVLCRAVDVARERGTALHLVGLLSDGGVHSHQTHLYALLRLAKERGLAKVFVHPLLDGRDTPPSSGLGFVEDLQRELREVGVGRVATVMGRYYGMDRDNRWDRVERAWKAFVAGEGDSAGDAVSAVSASYAAGRTDEFMEPAVVVDGAGSPVGRIGDGDSILFFNFRADRAREITRAFVVEEFPYFQRPGRPSVEFAGLTQYDASFGIPAAFAPQTMSRIFAESLAGAGLRNLRIAETEKYAHVTYFFNGGVETVWSGESRIMVPSPKVATYDLRPEMSAFEVADRAASEVVSGRHEAMVLNFANGDMVGHTGVIPAAIRAVEAVDANLRKVVEAIWSIGGVALVTADHGNAEKMVDETTGEPHTAHTTNPVPMILADPTAPPTVRLRRDVALDDVAPTMLALLGVPVPPEMTGGDLRENVGPLQE